jgi:3-hydroxyacyl-[acyl-carrier-protein] dehydratase
MTTEPMAADAGTTTAAELAAPLEAADIMALLPHRYPFLLVDRVVALEPGRSIEALKNVSANEPHFTGHFPGRPIMPGVLTVEALAQAAGIAVLALPAYRGKFAVFAGIDECRFRRTVVPGDQLVLRVTIDKLRGMFGRATGVASVGDEVATEATLSIIIPRDQSLGAGITTDA